ncbi:hypothetical protein KUCAC02_012708 [Chaenocephalus aceratus]|uniref:Uncharacterized protein n=1 Tax=Chaenocephalus aceratus TaxID=36190 RepID=A0ACB9XCC7_CHAAC|nr:hypothetical protein KUCAC02_012708 [Chaenocephalus aceratus]
MQVKESFDCQDRDRMDSKADTMGDTVFQNFLRFLWHRNNDLEQPIVEYRMRVHVFGNSPSPAVANYALRKASKDQEGSDFQSKHLVERHFYVDDGLI